MADADPFEALVTKLVRSKVGAAKEISFAALDGLAQEAGGLPATEYARFLIAHLAATGGSVIVDKCAQAICAAADWEALLVDLLIHMPVTQAGLFVVARVFEEKVPGHPLVDAMKDMVTVIPAMDLRDDGNHLMLSTDIPLSDGVGLILGLEDPIQQATSVAVTITDNLLVMAPASSSEWLQRSRSACPAAVLICRK